MDENRKALITNIKAKVRKSIKAAKDDEIISCFRLNREEPVTCDYCQKELLSNAPFPFKAVPSIDHDIPKALGGTDKWDNLVLCCHECNIMKSTLTGRVYRKLLKAIDSDPFLKIDMFEELWKGRFANKLGRVNGNE